MLTLKDINPVARKTHRCDLCDGPINPGEKYNRQTNIFDGNLYDFKTCPWCIENDMVYIIWDWAGNDEGATFDALQGWANDAILDDSDPKTQELARQALARQTAKTKAEQ